jgi:hypothetical protein
VTRSRQTKASSTPDSLLESAPAINRIALDETTFRRMIAIERKRTERSKAPFVLMLLEAVSDDGQRSSSATLHRIAAALLASSRDTDLIGWYKDDEIVGTMFSRMNSTPMSSIRCEYLSICFRMTGIMKSQVGQRIQPFILT